MMQFTGQLIENRIFIHDLDESRRLFADGYYGKPLGISKPKNADFNSPLVLDLIEGYYLILKNKLYVFKYNGTPVSSDEILKECKKQYVNFKVKYKVFENLRDKSYVVTPGIKFGCDFAVYIHGPGIDHAPYLVKVLLDNEKITSIDIVLAGRLATTVKKQFVLAIVNEKEDTLKFVGFDWWRA
ncbi:tRNA-intron lyase [Candidatus Nitrosocosmicus franklandus]|uniref:tRNA-splicing endonuclease n=1 Tax=Candidatus Nitrosocosmicus franklandianus TaxID=1798806 RepID=A0A484IGU9_9ARCH|nr:tRNA-intron lyase [Candidatus Nitrosocosmicus franklandus]VFJ15430.1 tRNA-splicing endonuclease [Candidatus Nitrosocosmicus franklandus]